MKTLRRLAETLCVLLTMNIPWLCLKIDSSVTSPVRGAFAVFFLTAVLVLFFLVIEILPVCKKGLSVRLQIIAGGYELIVTSFWCLAAETAGCLFYLFHEDGMHSLRGGRLVLFIVNTFIALFVLFLHFQNGFWRTAVCSVQLGIGMRVLMLLFWWLPVFNIALFIRWCAIIKRELLHAETQYLLNTARAENAVCRTRYPVIMVHGIFFRDWQYFCYWGRIPVVLKKNGASLYYGRQQSALPVAESAAELKQEIERVLAQTGAEKVNIIAHSKGGLDARYAITMLGLSEKVASLTTINTPHRGCRYVDVLLQRLPDFLIRFIPARYNALFKKLGDKSPDFLGGVQDLTAAACSVFNKNVPDSPLVSYQSITSKMRGMTNAGFPLNVGYLLSKRFEGDNDGLVSVSSAMWGSFLGLVSAGKKGVSHGDMIDLTRRNIKGFNVCEFYVQLFKDLKEQGF